MGAWQPNDLLQSKKGEYLNRVPPGVFNLGHPSPAAPGYSGPEAQIALRQLALRDIEFVGAGAYSKAAISRLPRTKDSVRQPIHREHCVAMTRRALDVIPSYQFA